MRIYRETLANGLTVLAEPVPGAGSLAMRLMVPGGLQYEPSDRLGVGSILTEMMFRGAGGLSAREHSDALDRLGVQRDTDTTTYHVHLSATLIGENLSEALPLLLDMVTRPHLDGEALEPSRDLAIQAVEGLDDEPQQRVMLELKRLHHPDPIGRSSYGVKEHLEAVTLEDVRGFAAKTFVPRGGILSFAGKFDWEALLGQVRALTADWTGDGPVEPTLVDSARGYRHLDTASSQVHIALACEGVSYTDPDRALASAAVAVLSGGMSGRLFTEVREKRGLCYSVYAAYAGQKDRGTVSAYAGTTTPRAQETLDVTLGELRRLRAGVTEEEFARAVVGMKSRLVMQGESTGARAAAIAGDQFILGEPRSLDDLSAEVDALTVAGLNRFVSERPLDGFTVVTIGPERLVLS